MGGWMDSYTYTLTSFGHIINVRVISSGRIFESKVTRIIVRTRKTTKTLHSHSAQTALVWNPRTSAQALHINCKTVNPLSTLFYYVY